MTKASEISQQWKLVERQNSEANGKTVELAYIQNIVAAIALLAYAGLIALYVRFVLEIDSLHLSNAALVLASLGGVFILINRQPRTTVIAILCLSATINYQSIDELELLFRCIKGSALGILIYVVRAKFHWFVRTLAEKIYVRKWERNSSRERQPPVESERRIGSEFAPSHIAEKSLAQWIGRVIASSLVMIFAAYLSAFLIAQSLATSMPYADWRKIWWVNLTDNGFQFWPSPLLITLLIATAVLLTHIDWRRFDAAQAGIVVRVESLRWQYAELKRILIQRRKIKNKLQRDENDQGQ